MSGRAMPIAALELPLAIDDLARHTKRLTAAHGKECTFRQVGQHLIVYTPGEICHACHHCLDFEREAIDRLASRSWVESIQGFMVVCPECGNKRCPKANDHDYECSGSNGTGQFGSAYP